MKQTWHTHYERRIKGGGNGDVDWLQVEEAMNARLSMGTLDIFKKKRRPANRLIQEAKQDVIKAFIRVTGAVMRRAGC